MSRTVSNAKNRSNCLSYSYRNDWLRIIVNNKKIMSGCNSKYSFRTHDELKTAVIKEQISLLVSNTEYKHVDISNNKLGYVDVVFIADLLKTNNSIIKILLDYNNIGDVGAYKLAIALRHNNATTDISIKGNNINDGGTSVLFRFLESNTTIKHINISNNNIQFLGAQAISSYLEKNETLEELVISKNHIGDIGAQVITQALGKNRTLKHIDLSDNDIRDRGGQAIAELLLVNHDINCILLHANPYIGNDVLIKIIEASETNQGLTRIRLTRSEQDHLESQVGLAMLKAVKTNHNITYTFFDPLNHELDEVDQEVNNAIHAEVENNRMFLKRAIEHLRDGVYLDDSEIKTIKAHILSYYCNYYDLSGGYYKVDDIISALRTSIENFIIQCIKDTKNLEFVETADNIFLDMLFGLQNLLSVKKDVKSLQHTAPDSFVKEHMQKGHKLIEDKGQLFIFSQILYRADKHSVTIDFLMKNSDIIFSWIRNHAMPDEILKSINMLTTDKVLSSHISYATIDAMVTDSDNIDTMITGDYSE